MSTETITRAGETLASQTFTVEVKRVSGTEKRLSPATDEVRTLVKRAKELADREKKAKADADAIKSRLSSVMLAHGIDAFTHEGKNIVSVSETYPQRFDAKSFDEAHPGLREAWKRPSEHPTVTVRLA